MFRRKKKETALQKSQREQLEYEQNLEQLRKAPAHERRRSSASDVEPPRRGVAPPPQFSSARAQTTRRAAREQSPPVRGSQTLAPQRSARPLPAPPPGGVPPGQEALYGDIDDFPPSQDSKASEEVVYGEIDLDSSAPAAEVHTADAGQVVYGSVDVGPSATASGEVVYGGAPGPGHGEVVYGAAPATASGEVMYGSTIDSTEDGGDQDGVQALYATMAPKKRGAQAASPVPPVASRGIAPAPAATGDAVYAAVAPKKKQSGHGGKGGHSDAIPDGGDQDGVQALYATMAPKKRGSPPASPVAPAAPASSAYSDCVPMSAPKDIAPKKTTHSGHGGRTPPIASSPPNRNPAAVTIKQKGPGANMVMAPVESHSAVDADPYSMPDAVNKEVASERRAVDAWLRVPIDRGQAQTSLQSAGLANGAYLVRKSSAGTFGLSIVSHKTIFHMKIMSETDRSGRNMFFIQGDQEYGTSFGSVWELLVHYKTPTDRLTWHLVRCISETYIPQM